MPKVIFNAQNGLSQSNRNEDGKYSVGDLIDQFLDWGYLKPSYSGTTITGSLASTVRDMADIGTTTWVIDDNKLYSIVTGALNVNRDFSGSSIGTGLGLVNYTTHVGGSDAAHTFNGLFYIGTAKAGLYYYSSGDHYDDDWLNSVPANTVPFVSTEHPYIIWKGLLMIGDGQYLIKFDGQTGDNGTYTAQYFDVGVGWYIKSLFKYQDWLGIVVRDQYDVYSDIILIDGSSATQAVKRVSVKEKVISGVNLNNDLIFITQDLNGKCWLKSLGDNGLEPIQDIKFENKTTSSTFDTFSAPTRFSELDVDDNKMAFGCKVGTTPFVFVYGRNKLGQNNIINKKYSPTGQTITLVKNCGGALYIGSYTGTNYYLQKFSTGSSVSTLKLPFKDYGQKVRINYVKYYFKPLVASDSMTAGLEIDYGTSITLKDNNNVSTIAYATDGAITSKKFNVGRDCFSFRPTLNWTAGGTSLAFVVCDYDFLPNDN